MPIKLGGLLARKVHVGNDNYGFKTERSASNRQLVNAFRGQVPAQRVLSGAPELAVLRSGRAGGFLVTRFVGLPRGRSGPEAGASPAAGGGEVAAASRAVLQPAAVLVPVAAPAPAAAAQQDLDTAMSAARQTVAEWAGATAVPRGVAEQTLRKLPANAALETAFKAVERAAAQAQTPEQHEAVAAARKDLTRLALRLELGVRAGSHSVSMALEAATDRVLTLADGLRKGASGDAAALVPALVSRLSSGLAADRAATGLAEDVALALHAVEYGAATITASVEWPRDGSALLQMSGRNPALDPYILAARETAIGNLMARAEEIRQGVEPGQLPADEKAAIAGRAQTLARADAEGVAARRLLEAALTKEGVAVDLGAVRLDAGFAQGLRQNVKDADKIGMAVAAAVLLEERAAASSERRQLGEDLKTVAESLTARREALAQQPGFAAAAGDYSRLRRAHGELQARYGAVLEQAAGRLSAAGQRNPERVREAQAQALLPLLQAVEHNDEEFGIVRAALEDLGGARAPVDAAFAQDVIARMTAAPARLDELASDRRLQDYAALGASARAVARQREAITSVAEQRADRLKRFEQAVPLARAASDAAEADVEAAGGEVKAPPALVERRTTLRERHALAQRNVEHGRRDVAALDGIALRRGGLTAADLKALGLDDRETRAALEWSAEFVSRGLWSSAQVGAAADTMSAVGRTLKDGLGAGLPVGQSNDQLAVNLGRMLLANVTGARPGSLQAGLELAAAVADALPDERVPIEDPYAASAQAYQRGVLGLLEDGRRQTTGAAYLATSEGLADTSAALDEMRLSRTAHRQALAEFNAAMPARARTLDADRPAGLAISGRLLSAQRIIRNYGGLPPPGSLLRENLEAIAGDLRGLDPATLTKPRLGGRRMSLEALRDLVAPTPAAGSAAQQTSARLMNAARAVVFLREGEAEELRALESEAAGRVRTLDAIVDTRARAMGPEQAAKLRDVIRAAVLEEFATAGQPLAKFNPAQHHAGITARLRSWGVDTERFFPEINHQLAAGFGATELTLWAEQGQVSTRQLLDPAREFIPPGMAARPRHEPPDRQAAVTQVDALKPGSIMKFFGGSRWEVSVGVSVGAAGAGAKYEQTNVSNLEIERGADDYVLVVRSGAERSVSADGSYGLPKNPYANVAAKLEGEYIRSYISGVRLKFPNDGTGREHLKRVLDKLMAGADITRQDLALAEDIAPASEDKWAVKGTVSATAGLMGAPKLKAGGEGGDLLSIGPSAGFRAMAGGMYGRELVTESNLNEDAFERATEVALTATAGITARVKGEAEAGAGVALDDNAGFSLDASAELKFKRIVKGAFDAEGRLGPTFIVKNVRAASIMGRIDRIVAGPAFDAHIEDPARAGVKASYQALLRSAEGNDMIRFRFSLKPERYAQVNALKAAAQAVDERYQKLGERARQTEEGLRLRTERAACLDRIETVLDDEANYEPEKVFHIPFKESATYDATVPALVYQRGRYAENQVLWRANVVDLKA